MLPFVSLAVALLLSPTLLAERADKSASMITNSPATVAPRPGAVAWRTPDVRNIPKPARHATSVIEIDASALRRLAIAGGGTLHRFPLGPSLDVDLELVTLDAFAADAEIETVSRDQHGVVRAERMDRHDAQEIHLVGLVAGALQSHAFLSQTAAGTFGYVELGERTFIISSGPFGSRLGLARYELTALPEGLIETPAWSCATPEPVESESAEPPLAGEGGLAGTPPCRQIRIAWETDQEFLSLFSGNTTAATGYVSTMAAALTAIYTRDVNARLSVRYLRLWSSTDPWNGSNTSAQLEEFANYWQTSMTSVTRDLAHFLSGRGLGGGVAYLPGICAGGAAYGVSANLGGFFPTPLADNNGQNWDIYVVAHELGHNFGAPHTHNYNPPLDGCGSSPQDCTVANADEGTIMSYCHLCSGGVQNIKLRFHEGNISSIEQRLASVGCNYTGPATLPYAATDRVQALATIPLTVDVLANDIDFNCEPTVIGTINQPYEGGIATRSVGTGPGGRDQLIYVMPDPTFTGVDTVIFRVRDTSGQESLSSLVVEVAPVRVPENPVNDVAALDVAYYVLASPTVLPNFSTLTPYLTGTAAQVNVSSSSGNFATSGRADNVGAVYTGWVTVPTTGVWTFFTNSDDGSRLFIGSSMIVNNDGLHGMVERSGSIALAAGTHAIRIEFFERDGGAGLIASWQGPEVAKAVIPASALTRGGSNLASDIDNDGDVDAADLSVLLSSWGPMTGPSDINRDGSIDAADLSMLLSDWTG